MTGEGICNTLSMCYTKSSSSSAAEVVACCSVGSVDMYKDAPKDSDLCLVKTLTDTSIAS